MSLVSKWKAIGFLKQSRKVTFNYWNLSSVKFVFKIVFLSKTGIGFHMEIHILNLFYVLFILICCWINVMDVRSNMIFIFIPPYFQRLLLLLFIMMRYICVVCIYTFTYYITAKHLWKMSFLTALLPLHILNISYNLFFTITQKRLTSAFLNSGIWIWLWYWVAQSHWFQVLFNT